MNKRGRLLNDLTELVTRVVDVEGEETGAALLAIRLDVLERVVQLLRIRAGRVENHIPIDVLWSEGVRLDLQAGVIRVTGLGAVRNARVPRSSTAHSQVEMQRVLVLYLLRHRDREAHINSILNGVIEFVASDLTPADVETTRTGVTRVVTTLRSAARSLRLNRLLNTSTRSHFRTWELSVLGVIVGAMLHRNSPQPKLAWAGSQPGVLGAFGANTSLDNEISEILRELADPAVVVQQLSKLFTPNSDVFESFEAVAKTISEFCKFHGEIGTQVGNKNRLLTVEERAASDQLWQALADACEPLVLREDMSRSLAIDDLK